MVMSVETLTVKGAPILGLVPLADLAAPRQLHSAPSSVSGPKDGGAAKRTTDPALLGASTIGR